jgi:hypothetical protein
MSLNRINWIRVNITHRLETLQGKTVVQYIRDCRLFCYDYYQGRAGGWTYYSNYSSGGQRLAVVFEFQEPEFATLFQIKYG